MDQAPDDPLDQVETDLAALDADDLSGHVATFERIHTTLTEALAVTADAVTEGPAARMPPPRPR